MECKKPRKACLSISHTSYLDSLGGMEKFICDQSNICRENGYEFIALYPITNIIIVKGHVIKRNFIKWGVHINKDSALTLDTEEVLKILDKFEIFQTYIHSLIQCPVNYVIDIIKKTNSHKVFFYIHDYNTLCYSHILMKNNKRYCGPRKRNINKCLDCKFFLPSLLSQKKFKTFFKELPNVHFIFPSKISEEIWSSTYPDVNKNLKHIVPHQKFDNNKSVYQHDCGRLRIAYVGYKAFNKGWNIFVRFVEESKKLALPFDFYILGKSDVNIDGVRQVDVSFHKNGTNAMVDAIRTNKIDIAFLWSPWPETYSYTFYESYIGGAEIITNINSGNIAAQTKSLACGIVFDNENDLISNIWKIDKYVRAKKSVRPNTLIPNSDFLYL